MHRILSISSNSFARFDPGEVFCIGSQMGHKPQAIEAFQTWRARLVRRTIIKLLCALSTPFKHLASIRGMHLLSIWQWWSIVLWFVSKVQCLNTWIRSKWCFISTAQTHRQIVKPRRSHQAVSESSFANKPFNLSVFRLISWGECL